MRATWAWCRRALPLLVVALPMVVLVVAQARMAPVRLPVGGDMGVLELATQQAMEGGQALGPYSRFGWRHPGPFLFYWNGPFWAATGRELGGLALAAAVLQGACLVGVVALARAVGGRRAAWTAAGVTLVFVAAHGAERLRNVWNPSLTVGPTALLVVAGVAVVAGRRWALPVLALASSIAVQVHVGSGPTALVVVVVSLAAAAVAERHRLRRWLVPAGVAALVSAALWWAPVAEEVGPGPGNLSALVEHFAEGGGEAQSWTAVGDAGALLLSPGFPSHNAELDDIDPPTGVAQVAVVGLLVALVAGVAVGARRGDRTVLAWALVPLVAVVAGAYSLRVADGPLFLYLVRFLSGTALAAWLAVSVLAASALLESAERRVAARAAGSSGRSPLARHRRAVASVTVATTALLAVPATVGAVGTAPVVDEYADPAAEDVLDDLVRYARKRPGAEVVLRIASPETWITVAAVAEELADLGYDVRVDEPWETVFGPAYTTDAGRHRGKGERAVRRTLGGATPVGAAGSATKGIDDAEEGPEPIVFSFARRTDGRALVGLRIVSEAHGLVVALGGDRVVSYFPARDGLTEPDG